MADLISPEGVEALFTRADGSYLFARWGRPIVPVVFGTDDKTLEIVKGAVEAVVMMAGHQMAETDPELGVNLMFFFFREWDELLEVPDMDRMIPDLGPLVARLKAADANQYRIFRFDEAGAIKASFVFLRMDDQMSQVPADTLALAQVAQTILLWSDLAFTDRSVLAQAGEGQVILRPDIGAVIRAGYDPVMPAVAQDASHALRLSARLGQM
ncbi:hypothetical protein FIU89_04210 [Roseovarius sp. THAF27]|uniref:hypothetical protein n=1 Tax=Roseovarius sp. THAF27 TaxID=2587850 RepID=UPI001267BC7B|nr:hypothetical protein [Roseovarius sp. THAF27]QFT79804.1 hypothetical protein FIU89_04210 [Roseovarius sp. THAF27]